jgi:hypothetical protein
MNMVPQPGSQEYRQAEVDTQGIMILSATDWLIENATCEELEGIIVQLNKAALNLNIIATRLEASNA